MDLQLNEVSKSFGDRKVLTNFSATWSEASTIALMGPSGSGKSTLLAIISNLLESDHGTVTYIGGERPKRSDIAWILQSTPMLNRRTAIDNVMLGPSSRRFSRTQARGLALDAMQLLDITGLSETPVYRLSGGERQRVAVARAVASQTPIILADEPTAALDPVSRDRVSDAIRQSSQRGALVIVATHDPDVAATCEMTVHLQQPSTVDR